MTLKKGHVALIGAGPGDAGLFTLRGRELLEAADCVVYDRRARDDAAGGGKNKRRQDRRRRLRAAA